jgi:inorganic pyrophosphatase
MPVAVTHAASFIGQMVQVTMDRPLGSRHPLHHFEYLVNYGFIPHTVSGDGEALDAYVLGISEPLTRFTGRCIAVIHRLDDDDDKLIVVPDGITMTDEDILSQTDFVEQYFQPVVQRR